MGPQDPPDGLLAQASTKGGGNFGRRWGVNIQRRLTQRGAYLPLEKDEALLWTQGSVGGVNVQHATQDVYKEGMLKPVPSPILIRRFSGPGGWHDTCAGILGLTKMDWNNNTLYKKLPVTLVYSARFA